MKSKRKSTPLQKNARLIDTSAAEFLAEGVSQPMKPKPEELLRRWIKLHSYSESGTKPFGEDKKFMEEADLIKILKDIPNESIIISTIMDVAYLGPFTNPYAVVDSILHDNLILNRIKGYFQNNQPKHWNLAFCELIAACKNNYANFYEQCNWRSDRDKARALFGSFVSGGVSATLHSPRLYNFFYYLFFGGQGVTSSVLQSADLRPEEAELMQGLIAKGQEGRFIWDFETFMSS